MWKFYNVEFKVRLSEYCPDLCILKIILTIIIPEGPWQILQMLLNSHWNQFVCCWVRSTKTGSRSEALLLKMDLFPALWTLILPKSRNCYSLYIEFIHLTLHIMLYWITHLAYWCYYYKKSTNNCALTKKIYSKLIPKPINPLSL